MKKCYHMTSLGMMRTLTTTGLTPVIGDIVRIDKTSEPKVLVSEGIQGIVAEYAKEVNLYNEIKKGKILKDINLSEKNLDSIKISKNFEDYYNSEGILISFNANNIDLDGNFVEAYTKETIEPEDLRICYLKNLETKENYFERDKIMKYLAGKVPVESIHYVGNDATEEKTQHIRNLVQEYVNEFKRQINVYKFGDFELHEMEITDYVNNKKTQIYGKLTGQSIGHDTMKYLLDVEKVQAVELQLDRDVAQLELVNSKEGADKVRTLNENN